MMARSIRGRMLLLSAAWLLPALIGAWLVISALLTQFITARFDAETAVMADALIAATEANGDGLAEIADPPPDPRFTAPLSGWYWQVAANGTAVLRSESLYDGALVIATAAQDGLAAEGPDGAALRALTRPYTIAESDEALSLTVTAPQAEIDAAIRAIRRPLALALIVLGLGLVAGVLLQVTAGLSALREMGRGVGAIRSGAATSLPAPDARELQPMAEEINGLIAHNHAQLNRSRDQIGNLAHSLKTPLMALANDLPADHAGQALIARMDRQIAWHLKQARSAGGRHSGQARAHPAAVADDIALVLARALEDADITLDNCINPTLSLAVEPEDLQEMMGNLMENAAKWARSRIVLSAHPDATGDAIRLIIADDGPGIAAEARRRALTRGTRLDERGPEGSGLGLAIVSDLAAQQGGALALERAPNLGGLSAELRLPV